MGAEESDTLAGRMLALNQKLLESVPYADKCILNGRLRSGKITESFHLLYGYDIRYRPPYGTDS